MFWKLNQVFTTHRHLFKYFCQTLSKTGWSISRLFLSIFLLTNQNFQFLSPVEWPLLLKYRKSKWKQMANGRKNAFTFFFSFICQYFELILTTNRKICVGVYENLIVCFYFLCTEKLSDSLLSKRIYTFHRKFWIVSCSINKERDLYLLYGLSLRGK